MIMKRLITLLLLTSLLSVGVPTPFTAGDSNEPMWEFSASAKKKNTKKKTTPKSNRKSKTKKKKSTQGLGVLKPKKRARNTSTIAAPLAAVPVIASDSKATNSLLWVTVPRNTINQTVNYKAMTVYFNRLLHIPNCVAYELTNTMVSMADAPTAEKRKNHKFLTDGHVAGCPEGSDYRKSGYTRGHMAPAMDMRWDHQAMADCFLMTNMCPQEQKLNNDDWRKLEERIHRWAKRDGRLIVFTGPIMGNNPLHIGPKNDIAVPDAFFKVIYAPQQQRAIAFIYANKPCPASWRNYAVSIDEVERRTGIDFLPSLPNTQQQSLERMSDPTAWD